MNQSQSFPPGFRWGVATAAYQVEGAVAEGGRGPSIWDTFSHTPGRVSGGHTGDVACDHFHRYPEDVATMARLGVNAYRFSVSWPRIQPGGTGKINRAGLDFYRRLVDALLDKGIEPWLTLYHWDLPQELEDTGGWADRDTAMRFAAYASLVAQALGDRVRHYTTLNEPWCSAFLGYASGQHAPGRREPARAVEAVHHLLLGHGLAVRAVRAARRDSRVGISLNLYAVSPASSTDGDAARRIDGLANRLFLDPVLLGRYPEDVVEDLSDISTFEHVRDADAGIVAAPLDFLGINYYSRYVVGANGWRGSSEWPGSEHVRFGRRGYPVTAMDWEIDPDGLYEVLRAVHDRYPPIPLYITENGAAFDDSVGPDGTVDDPDRVAYLDGHLRACHRAIADGVPLRGYFAWSLLDNFEWSWGYDRRFGIMYVDYRTQRRIPKASAGWYAEVTRRNGLPPG